MKEEEVIPKVWRSELKLLSAFVFFSIVSVVVANKFSRYILLFPDAPLFNIGGVEVRATLPLVWFVPFISLCIAAFRIYDVRYSMDASGIEAREGILSLRQSITRVRYEDIRSVQTEHSLLDRLLDTGQVEISTAASGTTEVTLKGIAAPDEVRKIIELERDARQKAARKKVMQVYDESVNI